MIKPIFSRWNPELDAWQWGLDKHDFGKIQAGYGCGRCLEDFQGMWRPVCPVCGNQTEVTVDAPSEWRGPRE